jgi:hypothetical protein
MMNGNESVDNWICLNVGETLLNSYKKNFAPQITNVS